MPKSIRTKEYQDFAKQLKRARLEAGLTQVEVAKKLEQRGGKPPRFPVRVEEKA